MAETEKVEKTKVPSRLKAKNDGRKKAWWVKRIEELERELELLRAERDFNLDSNGDRWVEVPINNNYNEIYANGFVDAMNRFQIRNKASRKQIKHNIMMKGPDAVKRLRGSIFS
jgi:hypothetical protein